MSIFTTVILASEEASGVQLRILGQETGLLEVLKVVTPLPSHYALSSVLSGLEPAVVLIDTQEDDQAFEIGLEILLRAPKTIILGMNATARQIVAAKQAGFQALLPPSVSPHELRVELRDAVHRVLGQIEENLFAFLPCKAGSGASTVVFNVACAIARDLHKSVLVIDGDLRSGVQAMLLNRVPSRTFESLLTQAAILDRFLWETCITEAYDVNWLLSGRCVEMPFISWEQWHRVLEFAKTKYDAILVDLPEVINDASAEVVRRSRWVFAVATPEVLSLKLAQQRFFELKNWKIELEKIFVLLNRHHASDPSADELSKTIGQPVFRVIPNHYSEIHKAIIAGAPVSEGSKLGNVFSELAQSLMSRQAAPASDSKGSWSEKLKTLWQRH